MSTDPAALPTPLLPAPASSAPLGRALRVVADESATLVLLAGYLCLTLLLVPDELTQDSWLTLVGGREVVENGLPRVDTLTAWTLGREWVDQQWLAQAAVYRLWLLGGTGLVALAHVGVLLLTIGAAVAAARNLGGSRGAVTLTAAATALVAPWALQLRSQALALPLFVALLWLLAADSRSPGRRVYLVLPLLVVWANVHGTVVLAALFVALRGGTVAVAALRARAPARSWLPKAAALATLPFACLFASPYGVDLAGYYRSLFLNPTLREFVVEWQASTPSPLTALFYCLAVATAWLLARNHSRLTGFETAALVAATASGVLAIRSVVWFGLCALLFLPLLLDGERRRPRPAPAARRRLPLALGTAALATSVAAVAVVATRPDSWFLQRWSVQGARQVAALAAERPQAKVFSDDRNADWLLWRHPQLAGRIAHDVRFELLEPAELTELHRLRETGGDWQATIAAYDVLAVDTVEHDELIAAALGGGGFRRVWRDDLLTVLARP